MPFAWINGTLLDREDAHVGIGDAGLLHAAGVFTTMRARDGAVERIPQHLRRLRHSCEALFVPLLHDDAALTAAAGELLGANGLGDARLRFTVTRGQTVRDPLHGESFRPTCILTADALAPYPAEFYERGMTVALSGGTKLNPYDPQAGHKTLAYVSRFAVLKEAAARGAGEALLFNVHNFLQGGCISNVFLVEELDGAPVLVTPPTNEDLQEEAVRRSCPYPRSNALPGVTRGAIIEWAKSEGIAVQRLPIDVSRLLAAQEVFLTNSIMGTMPVTRVEEHAVGQGTPGRLTRRSTAV